MAEPIDTLEAPQALRELRDALATVCAACKSQSVPRIIRAVHEGEKVLEKTKEPHVNF